VHFYDQWPQETRSTALELYPADAVNRSAAGPQDGEGAVLVDATPHYMASPMAAPRIRVMAPHAKFIVVLRVWLWRSFSVPFVAPGPLSQF
jgi:hypothetical protein